MNKAFKNKLRKSFSEWYAEEVTKLVENGTQVNCVNIDICMSIVKELSSRWILSAYGYIHSSPDIIRNRFRKAGITSAIKDGIEAPNAMVSKSEHDPFESDDDPDC